jgi:hypothetical protein
MSLVDQVLNVKTAQLIIFAQCFDKFNGFADRAPKGTDQPSAALVQHWKQRGLLDDTLVVWGGEFGRTVYCQSS